MNAQFKLVYKNYKTCTPLGLRLYGGHPRMRLAMDCDCLVEGECKQYKKSMGTAINMVGMEDIENLYRLPLTGKLHSEKQVYS